MIHFRKFTTATRTKFGRDSVEPHFAADLTARNQSLKHLFCAKELAMKAKPKKKTELEKKARNVGEKARVVGEKAEMVGDQVSLEGEQARLVGEQARLVGEQARLVGEQARLVQGKAKLGGKEDILDDKGYKTIMRPAVRDILLSLN